ncbi:phosphatidylserine lipase ABHD16A [Anabrus simplex]|uniref:phosphatidylserine lipase ABHD16A n=1 Tax=Anabrus simplex TaxID=316456 RepID=UPI0035A27400
MVSVRLFCQCLFSPRLYKMYGDRRGDGMYDPNHFEKWGDQVIQSFYVMWGLGMYTWPVVAAVMYRRGYFALDGILTIAKCATGVGLVLALSYFVRGLGRVTSPQYTEFMRVLNAAKKNFNKDTKRALSQYDFDFDSWPVEFKWSDVEGDEKKHRLFMQRPSSRHSAVEFIFAVPCRIITFCVAHTFGLKLMYPGSMRVLNYMFFPALLQGRVKLIAEHRGNRFKLKTQDSNEIDTMFVDNRERHDNGSILVLCSEGNAGFYEIGTMATPIELGFSVLGWNHPGFGGSTGEPFPSQELNAVDCVMQFAIHHLGFVPENIVLFGWSIGGFPSTWVAMNYPDVKGVILDATFDDVMALAVTKMPHALEPIIKKTVRDYMNLNNFEQLVKYPGPVLLIRRTEDEVICTEDNNLSTNRGNNLLVKLLKYRYPYILNDETLPVLMDWLAVDVSQQSRIWNKYGVDEDLCNSTLLSYVAENSCSYPMRLGEGLPLELRIQLTIFLASKYMIDFKSTHCTPLPANLFQMPWDISPESDYVTI